MTTHLLYAGGYAAADQPGIHAFSFDSATGALTPRGSVAGVANPSFLAVHPNGHWLYAVSETPTPTAAAPGAVWAFLAGGMGASLEPINHQPSLGDWPCHLALDPSGRWLFVSNYGSGSLSVLPIGEDGALGRLTIQTQAQGHGPHPERQIAPHVHSATFVPDGRFVITADLGLDELTIYAFDPDAGDLRPHRSINTRRGAGPRHLAFHPSGRQVYVANELDNTVALYDYDPAGALRERQTADTLPPGAPENTVADIHVAPGGDRLYVSNRGHDSLAVFAIAGDGRLTRVAVVPCGGRWPRNFALAPGGRFLLVANQYSDEVAVLPLDAGTGVPGAPVARVAVPGAACLQFAPG